MVGRRWSRRAGIGIRGARSWLTEGLHRVVAEARLTFDGERTLLWVTLGGLGIVGACGLLVAKLLDDILGSDGAVRFDPSITSWMVDHRTSSLTGLARATTWFGNTWTVTIVASTAVIGLAALRRRRLAVFVAASASGAAIATTFGKFVVDRPRPPTSLWLTSASGAAFPSGHATQSIACYGAVAVVGWILAQHRWTRLLIVAVGALLALGIGSSRVYLGVHWATDVLCGWAVAGMWVAALVLLGWAQPRVKAALTGSRTRPGRVGPS